MTNRFINLAALGIFTFYSCTSLAGYNIAKYSLVALSSDEKIIVIKQQSEKEKEIEDAEKLIQHRADSICEILFNSRFGADSFKLDENHREAAYYYSDIQNKIPLPIKSMQRTRMDKGYVVPHTVFTEISCRKESAQGKTELATLEKPLSFSEFCRLIENEPYNCSQDNIALVFNGYRRLSQALELNPDSPDSIKAGLMLYLNDLSKRGKNPSEQLNNLLFPKQKKRRSKKKVLFFNIPVVKQEEDSFTILDPDALHSSEEIFFSELQNGNHPAIHGNERIIDAADGYKGETDSTIRIENERGDHYFKRYAINQKVNSNRALIGKKMAAEVAAFLLDQLMGYDFVPKTEFGTYLSKSGSIQVGVSESFIQAAKLDEAGKSGTAKDLFYHPSLEEERLDLQTFYYLGSFVDGHKGNIFIDSTNFKLKSIDHDSGFHYPVPFVRFKDKVYLIFGRLPNRYTSHTRKRIATLSFDEIKTAYAGVLTHNQIDAIWLRFNIVKADIIRKYGRLLVQND